MSASDEIPAVPAPAPGGDEAAHRERQRITGHVVNEHCRRPHVNGGQAPPDRDENMAGARVDVKV